MPLNNIRTVYASCALTVSLNMAGLFFQALAETGPEAKTATAADAANAATLF